MPLLENSQHEAFAQARFAGKTLEDACEAAGYTGGKTSASNLNRLFKVKERIAELYREAATQTVYEKTQVVRDLLSIIHACASEAAADNPLCEVRIGRDGPYHRFPPKLAAMARLIKLMGWDQPVKVNVALKDNLRTLLEEMRAGRTHRGPAAPKKTSVPSPSASGLAAQSHDESDDDASDSLPPDAVPKDNANHRSTTPQPSLPPRHEAFANARVKGLGVMAAYRAAGYTGDSPNLAWRLNSMPEVKARIAELNGGVEAAVGYGKDDAVRDLIAMIHAHPSDAGPDHPLCEMRMTAWGPYHRFPFKLGAIALLIKMRGWQSQIQVEVDHDPDAGFKKLAEFVRTRS